MTQASLFDAPTKPLSPTQREVYEALRVIPGAATTTQIQKALAEHGIPRDRNCIARRLTSLERKGLVERVGKEHVGAGVSRTTWRRT